MYPAVISPEVLATFPAELPVRCAGSRGSPGLQGWFQVHVYLLSPPRTPCIRLPDGRVLTGSGFEKLAGKKSAWWSKNCKLHIAGQEESGVGATKQWVSVRKWLKANRVHRDRGSNQAAIV